MSHLTQLFVLILIFLYFHSGTPSPTSFPFYQQQLKSKSYSFSAGSNDFTTESNISTSDANFLSRSLIPFYVADWLNRLKSSTKPVLAERELSAQCNVHIEAWVAELSKVSADPEYILEAETWALQMADAWGKIPEGILSGNTHSFGDWDECNELRGKLASSDSSTNIKGKYCTAYLIPSDVLLSVSPVQTPGTENMQRAVTVAELLVLMEDLHTGAIIPTIATCLPSSCSPDDIQSIVDEIFSTVPILSPFSSCSVNDLENASFNAGDISMIVILSVLGALSLLATVLDVLFRRIDKDKPNKRGLPVQTLLAFSVYTNIVKWSSTQTSAENLGCLHGIRFFSTCWVILGHTWEVLLYQPTIWNFADTKQMYKEPWSIYVIMNSTFSVDTFFFMSGFLAAYSILKTLDKTKGKLNVPMMYLHRYLRLTPTYALVIGFVATLYHYLGDGPYLPDFTFAEGRLCRKYWWHNLLYINNLVEYNPAEGEAMCLSESWYLANDMQFFVLSPLFVYLLWRWPRIGMAFLGLSSIGSIVAPLVIAYEYEMPPTLIPSIEMPHLPKIYYKPWTRIGPYLVGIWLGYIHYKTAKITFKMPKLFAAAGWLISTATALSLIFGIIPYYDPNTDFSFLTAAFYAGFSRFIWGTVVAWIIFACTKGYGGWINSFLSWKTFMPLGRLSFCVYIIALRTQLITHFNYRQPIRYDRYMMTNIYFSHVVMCYLIGFAVTIAAESPFIQLEKLFLTEGPKREPKVDVKLKGLNDESPYIEGTIPRVTRVIE